MMTTPRRIVMVANRIMAYPFRLIPRVGP
jgi:hypothetical protein